MSKMIQIVSRRPGFLRAGIPHPAIATYPTGFFTIGQLELLIAEPLLEVTLVDADSRQEEALTLDAIEKVSAEILARSVDANRLTGTRTGGSVGVAAGTGTCPGVPVGVPEATVADLDPAAALVQAGNDGRPLAGPVVTEEGDARLAEGPVLPLTDIEPAEGAFSPPSDAPLVTGADTLADAASGERAPRSPRAGRQARA